MSWAWSVVVAAALALDPSSARAAGAAGAASYPDVTQLPRPRLLWQQRPVQISGPIARVDGRGPLFLLRGGQNQLVALDPPTGRALWMTPDRNKNEILLRERGAIFPAVTVADEAGVVVASGIAGAPATAFTIAGGKRLWRYEDACELGGATGPFVLFQCPEGERVRVVRADSGKRVAALPVDLVNHAVVSNRALYLWSEERPRLRKHALVPGEPGWEVAAPPGIPAMLLAGADVLIWVGAPPPPGGAWRPEVRTFDARTGRLLWSRTPPGDRGEPDVRPALHQGRLLLSTEDALVLVALRTGAVDKRYELPPFLRRRQSAGTDDLQVLLSGERAVASVPSPSTNGMLITWARPGEAPVVLRRPFTGSIQDKLVGDIVIAESVIAESILGHEDQVIAGYSVVQLEQGPAPARSGPMPPPASRH